MRQIARRRQFVSRDEPRANRPANQAARDDADHRRGHGERRGGRHARLLEQRRERQPGGGAARQRDRSGQHAQQRRLTEQGRDTKTEDVLRDSRQRRRDEEEQHQRPTDSQQRHAGAETDRGKKCVLERRLKRGVEADGREPALMRDTQDRGDQQASDDRGRDVVPAEQRDAPLDAVADKEHDAGHREGLNQIEREQTASCPCIVPGARANPSRKGPE